MCTILGKVARLIFLLKEIYMYRTTGQKQVIGYINLSVR